MKYLQILFFLMFSYSLNAQEANWSEESMILELVDHEIVNNCYSDNGTIYLLSKKNNILFCSQIELNGSVNWTLEITDFSPIDVKFLYNNITSEIYIANNFVLRRVSELGEELSSIDISEYVGDIVELEDPKGLILWDILALSSGDIMFHKISSQNDSIFFEGDPIPEFGSRLISTELLLFDVDNMDTLEYKIDTIRYTKIGNDGSFQDEQYLDGFYYEKPLVLCNGFIINYGVREVNNDGLQVNTLSSIKYDGLGNELDEYTISTATSNNIDRVPYLTSANGKIKRTDWQGEFYQFEFLDSCSTNDNQVGFRSLTKVIEITNDIFLTGKYVMDCTDTLYALEILENIDHTRVFVSNILSVNTLYGFKQNFDNEIELHTLSWPAELSVDNDNDGLSEIMDCDDSNPTISDCSIEIPYNGIDDDCNPLSLDDDLDQDGFLYADDCNDNNSSINPNAIEIPNNDIDEDCDGSDLITSTHNLSDVSVKIYPNPVYNKLNIDIQGQLNFSANLYDLQGRLLKSTLNLHWVDVLNITSGIYLLEITDLESGQKLIERIVIE